MEVTLTQKKICQGFKIQNLGEYHDLLADVFKNFQNMGLAIYERDPAHFLSPTGLDMQKLTINTWKTKIKITNNHILSIGT